MNKFEALKQFQAWPPEWQRLCAECWIETEEDRPAVPTAVSNVAQVWCHADQIEAAKKLLEPVATLAHESVSARLAQDRAAAKVAAIPRDIQERICNGESVFLARNDSHLSDFNSAMANAKASGKPAAKVAAVPTKKTHIVNSRESTGFTLDELQYAQKGIEVGIKDCLLAEDMAGRFGRTKKAFQNYISLIHRNGIDLSTGRKKPHGVKY
jgi:hypothetical protein